MLQLETLQSLRGALHELLTVSTFDEQGRSEFEVGEVAMCAGEPCRGAAPAGHRRRCCPCRCFPAHPVRAACLADFVTPQAISAALDITAVQTKVHGLSAFSLLMGREGAYRWCH